MKKADMIKRYGEAAYEKHKQKRRERYKANREEAKAAAKKYNEEHPEQVIANSQEHCRKGGKRYHKNLVYKQIGLQGDKNKVRMKHGNQYRPYKDIIAPESQIHHEWIPNTAEYRGVALVEADAHIHGVVDVIEILDGKITLRTEEEVRRGEKEIGRNSC